MTHPLSKLQLNHGSINNMLHLTQLLTIIYIQLINTHSGIHKQHYNFMVCLTKVQTVLEADGEDD